VLNDVTPVVLTFNEQDNIARTLDALRWAKDVVVVDSFSDDRTLRIVAGFPNVRLHQRAFDSHAAQWNFAIAETGIATDWILALDADYVVTDVCRREISALAPRAELDAYELRFSYCVGGRPLRGGLYPPVTALFRRGRAQYVQTGHTQRVIVDGVVGRLSARLLHDDRKPLRRWLQSQTNYARLEAEYLLSTPNDRLRRTDRLRKMAWPAPPLAFIYALFVKGCIRDGWIGWHYALQRLAAEIMIALEVMEQRGLTRNRAVE
jgi:glycosyltransferase involved in cell wall biosynthesis